MRGASMGYEIEFKLIDIKDINKIQCVEETEGPFGDDVKVVCRHDITDEYCKTIMQRAMTRIAIECEWRYIGCTERIGHADAYQCAGRAGFIKYDFTVCRNFRIR